MGGLELKYFSCSELTELYNIYLLHKYSTIFLLGKLSYFKYN